MVARTVAVPHISTGHLVTASPSRPALGPDSGGGGRVGHKVRCEVCGGWGVRADGYKLEAVSCGNTAHQTHLNRHTSPSH